ncbi:UDP-N-acetylglucosamine 1-carboxyvinyltransferase, partial [Polaribacter sp.]|nr:UDP-N-acetylglucosamine 1-carboxyvinyltransferase [Polaribacter sp.]
MASFKIEGGHKLGGTIRPQGAKNEVLQILCAVLLTPERVVVNNVPDIIDVNKLIFILGELGVKVEKLNRSSYAFQADDIDLPYLESAEFKRDGSSLRGSIMLVGPLLAR